MLEGRRVRGREDSYLWEEKTGGKYEMRRKGEVCVGVMVNRWDGGIRGRVGDVEGEKCGRWKLTSSLCCSQHSITAVAEPSCVGCYDNNTVVGV